MGKSPYFCSICGSRNTRIEDNPTTNSELVISEYTFTNTTYEIYDDHEIHEVLCLDCNSTSYVSVEK